MEQDLPEVRPPEESVTLDWGAVRAELGRHGMRLDDDPPPRQFAQTQPHPPAQPAIETGPPRLQHIARRRRIRCRQGRDQRIVGRQAGPDRNMMKQVTTKARRGGIGIACKPCAQTEAVERPDR